MFARSLSLPRRQSFVSSVQPSASAGNAAQEQAVVVHAHTQQPVVLDDVNLPPELQQLVVLALCNPYETCTLEQLQKALQAFKAASGVNKLLHQTALPFLHAAFLRLFGQRRIAGASFDSLPLLNLPGILEGIVARSGLSGLQCLSDLVNGSLGMDPDLASKAFAHWIDLAKTATATTALPYQALPTLIAVRLGGMLQRSAEPSTHAMMLMKELVRLAKTGDLPLELAMPAMIEVFLVVSAKEFASNHPFRAPPTFGTGQSWMEFGSHYAVEAMARMGCPSVAESLLPVTRVLTTRRRSEREPLDQDIVLKALNYLAECPHPLLGCLAEALDIIQGMDLGHDAHVEELLACCAKKRASARLMGVAGGGASGSNQITPLAVAPMLVNGTPVTMAMLRELGVVRELGAPQ